jgi:HPt (histidine-containing phosphotransfer) domain-containing protein
MVHTTAPTADDETFDRAVIAGFLDDGADSARAFTVSVLDCFVEDSSTQLVLLRAASATGDTARLQVVAHRLRGGAATLGARRMARLCGEFEAHSRRNPEPEFWARLVHSVETEWQRVHAACVGERARLLVGGRA